MNARTKVSPTGDVAIPQDVRERLHWAPGTPLEVELTIDGIRLRAVSDKRPFPRKTLADLQALPGVSPDKAQPIEAISRLSDEDIRRLLDEQ